MEENKVTISLKEYIELYEGQKERNLEMQVLLELIFRDTELTTSKKELKFDYYDSKLMAFLKDKYPERYKKQLELLRNEIVELQKELCVTVDGVAGNETITAYNNKVGNETNSWDSIKHFKQSEFTCKCGCGLNNMNLAVVKIADKVREHFGSQAIVTSGSRCKQHNKEVGGVSNSRHLQGKAIDMYVKGVPGKDLLAYLQTLVNKGELRYTYLISNSNACHFDIL